MANKTVETMANKSILKYAVQRAIFCRCGRVADVRDAILVMVEDDGSLLGCERCANYDKLVEILDDAGKAFEVLRGRDLF